MAAASRAWLPLARASASSAAFLWMRDSSAESRSI
jgi:hypothetical protein